MALKSPETFRARRYSQSWCHRASEAVQTQTRGRRVGAGTSPGIHQGRSCSSSIRWLQLPVRSCRQLEGRVGLGAHPWQWELQGGGWVSPAMPCCWRHPPPIPMREECPEGRALSARASTGRKDQTQTCSSRDPSLYCHSPRGGTGSSGQAPRIGGGIHAGMGTWPVRIPGKPQPPAWPPWPTALIATCPMASL